MVIKFVGFGCPINLQGLGEQPMYLHVLSEQKQGGHRDTLSGSLHLVYEANNGTWAIPGESFPGMVLQDQYSTRATALFRSVRYLSQVVRQIAKLILSTPSGPRAPEVVH